VSATVFMMRSCILWASLLLYCGCSYKEYAPSKGKIITIKTDTLRFNDLGYVRLGEHGVEVALFSAGQVVETFTIEENICIRKGCLSTEAFYATYLHVNYPKETLKHIFRGEPIFNKRNLEQDSGGFKQYIQTAEYNIVYKVENGTIYFKDSKHNVFIKIREIE